MYDDIGAKIAALRRQAGLSQKELAQKLTALGEPLSDKALSKWEKGATLPSARQFLLTCRALEVWDVSGEFMGEGLSKGLAKAGTWQGHPALYPGGQRRTGAVSGRRGLCLGGRPGRAKTGGLRRARGGGQHGAAVP